MPVTLLAPVMLLGLLAVAIPPIIHLLNRRRFDVIDWAAMQFLQISQRTRRKVFIEELLLMLLRMGLIAIMVLALAGPLLTDSWLSRQLVAFSGKVAGPNRDVVLIIDGSYSMGYAEPGQQSADTQARQWAEKFIQNQLASGDGVAILQAKQQPLPIVGLLSRDRDQVLAELRAMPPVRGGVDWPAALQAAVRLLADSDRGRQEIYLLTDHQKQGWADPETLIRWELTSGAKANAARPLPPVRVIAFDEKRPERPLNWSLTPLQANRPIAVVGREITFRTQIQTRGSGDDPAPERLFLEIDGKPTGEIKVRQPSSDRGQVDLVFRHKFATSGSHLVTVMLDPDRLPGDNRQDLAIEVLPALPVLLVDGDQRPAVRDRGTDFVRKALSPSRDPSPSVVTRVLSISEFEAADLKRDVKEPGTPPRVLILCNVARLSPEQLDAVEKFLAQGGGLLVGVGDRSEASFYNEQLLRNGMGWLPAKLIEPVGNETEPSQGAMIRGSSLAHPAVALFREATIGGLTDARFPRYWQLSTKESPASTLAAVLNTGDPFLVERGYLKGRVLLCCVPLDDSWRTDVTRLPAYPALVHELVYYLAGVRGAESNLAAGQPIVFRPPMDESPGPVTVKPPEGPPKTLPASSWPLTIEDTRESGVYTVTTASGQSRYFVVVPDRRESDLTPTQPEDRDKVTQLVPSMNYAAPDKVLAGVDQPAPDAELWWLCMLGVIALLCSEVWMTRRIALQR